MAERGSVDCKAETAANSSSFHTGSSSSSSPSKEATPVTLSAPFKPEKGSLGFAFSANRYHESLPDTLYPVKVINVFKRKGAVKFKVHFQGWQKRHDTVVDKIIADDEEGRERKKTLDAMVARMNVERKTKFARERANERRGMSTPLRDKRSKPVGELGGTVDDGRATLTLQWPAVLKKFLFEDYENVTLKKMLIKLPKRIPIETLFAEFLEHSSQAFGVCSGSGSISEETFKQVLDGLAVFFDRALGPFLIYSFERLQYDAVREKHPEQETDHLIIRENTGNKKHKRLSQVYGCEHLLRLLHRLPELVTSRNLVKHEVETLNATLNHLLKFIAQKESRERYLSQTNFVLASNDYVAVLQDL